MQNRTCKTCSGEFPLTKEYFHVSKKNKNGYTTHCKTCINLKSKRLRDRKLRMKQIYEHYQIYKAIRNIK